MTTKPTYLSRWTVDEIIECLPITHNTAHELLRAMPNAYQLPKHSSDDFEEREPYTLAHIWDKLSNKAKTDIKQYEKEMSHPNITMLSDYE